MRFTLLLLLSLCFLAGCPNPNSYTTARPMAPGKVVVMAAPEVYGATDQEGETATVPSQLVLPTFGTRIGLTERVELGARLANLSSVAGDVKIGLARGKLDVAIDPGVQVYRLSEDDADEMDTLSGNVAYVSVPLLASYNLTRDASVIGSAGPMFGFSTGGGSAMFAQLGVGIDMRVASWLSLTPQLTFINGFSREMLFVGGLAFNVGRHPDFHDLGR